MATYTIQGEGNPIVPYTLLVTFPVNITMAYSNRVGSYNEYNSTAFNDQMQIAADNIENYYKTLPEFTVQDSSRNISWNCINQEESVDYPGLFFYDMVCNFTITNATAQVTATSQTDLTGTELETLLQTEADNAATNYKATKNWMDI